jgi:hypothetical protein
MQLTEALNTVNFDDQGLAILEMESQVRSRDIHLMEATNQSGLRIAWCSRNLASLLGLRPTHQDNPKEILALKAFTYHHESTQTEEKVSLFDIIEQYMERNVDLEATHI